jgi:hypothetical protein
MPIYSNSIRAILKEVDENVASPGLSTATYNSLAYRVAEIERHLHSAGSWFGAAGTPDGELHVADRIGTTSTALVIDGGNDTWGTWTQILGSDDTPARADMAYFDPHEIIVEDTENASEYFVQFARGDSGAAGYTAGNYTEFVFNATVQKETGIIDVHTGRSPAGAKLWARCWSVGDNTGTFSFFLGIHEYEG